MVATYEIPDTGLEITNVIEGVEQGYYQSIQYRLDKLSHKSVDADDNYRRTSFVISNYVYLIYERIQKNQVREIDYDQIRSWANKNKRLATLLLKEQFEEFPVEAFEKWISSEIDLLNCGMYRRSNRFTKNTYH